MDLQNQESEKVEPIDREECERLMKIANRDLTYADTFKYTGPPTILEGKQIIDAFADVAFINEKIKEEDQESDIA